ncbi:branched-chain amino acid ABC transporter permease [Azospirillum griseum]|uniref:Branched-chain amino acid ABC transporter permease n=1 Tax=Azospirillum griseum TaxID=2496639 RepID=A0A3S0R800_9PROT|nr:branched-chain amino acid ABC transporter permease [Azospirillum griseum]RTR18634.1 branched-chain amino acid ABC transporter permease [Azospirillum griseum]
MTQISQSPAPRAARSNTGRFIGLATLTTVVALLPLALPNAFYVDVAIRIAILAVNGIALNLLMGYTGQISLGHAGFFGLGAYGSAVLTAHFGWSPLWALLAAAAMTAVIAWGVARVILRLRGHYLAMATLGLGIIISIVLSNETAWTGGPDGMAVDSFSLFGVPLSGERRWYWVFGGLLIGTVILAQNLIDSPAGRALQALHGSETAASVAGIDVGRRKVGVFVLSATVAAVMGSLSAHYAGYINPGIAGFLQSVELVIIVVLGGMASIYGSIFGAVVMGLLPQLLAGYEGWDSVLFGLIMVVTMIVLPRGVVPSLTARLRSTRFGTKGNAPC